MLDIKERFRPAIDPPFSSKKAPWRCDIFTVGVSKSAPFRVTFPSNPGCKKSHTSQAFLVLSNSENALGRGVGKETSLAVRAFSVMLWVCGDSPGVAFLRKATRAIR
jgi:hypothetical protein